LEELANHPGSSSVVASRDAVGDIYLKLADHAWNPPTLNLFES
jgi:hypothetical protein